MLLNVVLVMMNYRSSAGVWNVANNYCFTVLALYGRLNSLYFFCTRHNDVVGVRCFVQLYLVLVYAYVVPVGLVLIPGRSIVHRTVPAF